MKMGFPIDGMWINPLADSPNERLHKICRQTEKWLQINRGGCLNLKAENAEFEIAEHEVFAWGPVQKKPEVELQGGSFPGGDGFPQGILEHLIAQAPHQLDDDHFLVPRCFMWVTQN